MDYKKKFSKKALKDFKLIDLAINKNDQKAYSEIMKSYKNSIYFTILKMIKNKDDAEDLTIEAFSKAFKNLHRFKKEFTFSTWLFRIATNNTIDFIRKKKLLTTSIHTSFKDEAGKNIELDIKDSNLNPNEITIKNEKIIIVRQLVNKLPEFGFSSIANILASIKLAKYMNLGKDDAIITVATDGADLYMSELNKTIADFKNNYDEIVCAELFGQYLSGVSTDNTLELSHMDKKRIFNLGYFTWVEQQGVSLEEFEKRKDQKFWNSHYDYMLSLDNQIKEFNNM